MTSEDEAEEEEDDDEEGADAAEEKEREEEDWFDSPRPRLMLGDPTVMVMNGSLRQVMETGAWADMDMTGKVVGKMEREGGGGIRYETQW